MTDWKLQELLNNGYEIWNAEIKSVDLDMSDHACMTLSMVLDGGCIGCIYGGIVIGKGYVGADEFAGSPKGIEYIMRIMDVVGADKFQDLKGKYVRVASNGWGSSVKIIGNIINDKWFDSDKLFEVSKCKN